MELQSFCWFFVCLFVVVMIIYLYIAQSVTDQNSDHWMNACCKLLLFVCLFECECVCIYLRVNPRDTSYIHNTIEVFVESNFVCV